MRGTSKYSPEQTERAPWRCAEFVSAILGMVLDDQFEGAHNLVYEHARHTFAELVYHPDTQSPSVPPPDPNEALSEEENVIRRLICLPEESRLLRIVGDVGMGKSTFVKHLLSEHFASGPFGEATPIYLDWRDFTASLADPLPDIYKHFHRRAFAVLSSVVNEAERRSVDEYILDSDPLCAPLREQFLYVEEDEMPQARAKALRSIIESDPVQFAYARINALSRSNRNRFVVVVDNVDHLRPQVLASLLDFIGEIHKAVVSLVIVAVRDHTAAGKSTYLPEAAVPSWSMRLYPPVISGVLERRLKHFFPKDFDVKVHRHVDALGKTLLLKDTAQAMGICRALLESPLKDPEAHEFLRRWSNYGIRDLFRVLQKLLHFHGFAKRGASAAAGLPFNMGIDDVIVAICLDSYLMFHPSKSQVCNLYSSGDDHCLNDRLVGFRLLQFLQPHTHPVPCSALRRQFITWGYAESSIDRQLIALLNKDAIWSDTGSPRNFDEKISFVRLSYRGALYLDRLVERVMYNYAVSFDVLPPTPSPGRLGAGYLALPNRGDLWKELESFADVEVPFDVESVVGRVLGLAEFLMRAELEEWQTLQKQKRHDGFEQTFGRLRCSGAVLGGLTRFLSAAADQKAARAVGLPSAQLQQAVAELQAQHSAARDALPS